MWADCRFPTTPTIGLRGAHVLDKYQSVYAGGTRKWSQATDGQGGGTALTSGSSKGRRDNYYSAVWTDGRRTTRRVGFAKGGGRYISRPGLIGFRRAGVVVGI